MKLSHIMILLLIFAWPLYYLYARQLGAISFLLLALFFLSITIKEAKKLKHREPADNVIAKEEKIKQDSR
ncbi:hypothetical protein ACQYAD_17455 [Neobacillus sp. SM06]|uniref:hypothetical protein n=1 Tax=Neobacillus sp. SM06 TaxID=3422492 RepID=UPI003D2CDE5D